MRVKLTVNDNSLRKLAEDRDLCITFEMFLRNEIKLRKKKSFFKCIDVFNSLVMKN